VETVDSSEIVAKESAVCQKSPQSTLRPTHEVPVYWVTPLDGGLGSCKLQEWEKRVGPGRCSIRFVELSHQPVEGKPSSEKDGPTPKGAASVEDSPVLPGVGVEGRSSLGESTQGLSINAAILDTAPSTEPRSLESLDLKSLADLHLQLEQSREQLRADLIVPGKIGGHSLAILVDSGATISVLSTRKWTQIYRDNPHLTLVSTPDRVQLASGTSEPMAGKVVVQLELAGQFYIHQVAVLNIFEEFILGYDFLAKHDVECDWKKGILKLRGKELEACRQYSVGDGKLRRLTPATKLQLPPFSHCVVQATVHHPPLSDRPDWGMSSATKHTIDRHGVLAGRALVDGRADQVCIPLLNLADSTVTIAQTETIAWLDPVEYVGTARQPAGSSARAPNQLTGQTVSRSCELQHAEHRPSCAETKPSHSKVNGRCTAVLKHSHAYTGKQCSATHHSLPCSTGSAVVSQSRTDPCSVVDSPHCLNTGKRWTDTDSEDEFTPEKGSDAPGFDLSQGVNCAERYDLPEHLRSLFEASLTDLEDEMQAAQLAEFLVQNQDVFARSSEDLGHTNLVQHKIDTGSSPPIRQNPRRIPLHKREIVDREVKRMLDAGVIEACNGPWSSPIVLVSKKNGEVRFCVDFRALNEVTRKDAYPLTRIEENLDTLQGAEWYSTLDLISGFWQVEVAEEDRDKTAFTIPGTGLFRHKKLPFGLTNSPACFSRLMELALKGLQWKIAVLYLDDIVVFSPNFPSHLERLGLVLARLRDAGLKLKPSKCHLLKKRVEFLGHIVSGQGVEVDPGKVNKVADWPVPQNLTQLRAFLGLCSYYRRFIQNFSDVAKPLYTLMEKNQDFEWLDWQQEAFDTLKKLLTQAPILGYPREDCPWILDTDASNFGIGAVLSQIQDGEERVIAYASKVLNRSQRNYCVTRRELLAIVTFVKQFHHYLFGTPFLVRTDHAALYWLLRKSQPDGQMARWIETLQNYNMTVEHRPGRKHGNADALSRCMAGCRDVDKLQIETGVRAGLTEIAEKAKEVLPEETVREVKTRSQVKKEEKEAQREADLALHEFFEADHVASDLSRGASSSPERPQSSVNPNRRQSRPKLLWMT